MKSRKTYRPFWRILLICLLLGANYPEITISDAEGPAHAELADAIQGLKHAADGEPEAGAKIADALAALASAAGLRHSVEAGGNEYQIVRPAGGTPFILPQSPVVAHTRMGDAIFWPATSLKRHSTPPPIPPPKI